MTKALNRYNSYTFARVRNWRRSLLPLALGLLAVLNFTTSKAETVSQKEASRIAQTFFNAANKRVMAKPKLVYNGRRLTTNRLFAPFYVYNLPTGGFVIVSAENKAFPILGYSLKSSFDPDHLNDTEKAMLRRYARDIEYIRYDSRFPEEAFKAWTHLDTYIDDLLKARYDATDMVKTPDDIDEKVVELTYSDDAANLVSEIYTPQQWEDMVTASMKKDKNTVLGIIDNDIVYSAAAHGRKGDYMRIWLGRPNDWLLRLMATEFLSAGQLADLNNAPALPEAPEEASFAFYDSYIKEMKEELAAVERMYEEMLHPTEPVVRSMGGGHFEVVLPEKVTFARIYNIAGSMTGQMKFRDTDTAVINLDAEPTGFYAALLVGESGKTYGVKLYR